MRKRGLSVARCPSVGPSVHKSVTLVHCIHAAEDIVNVICRPGSPFTLVLTPNADTQGGTHSAAAQNPRGGKIFQFSIEIAVNLGNGTR